MASYLPPQKPVRTWESTPPTPGQRAPLNFPTVRSGSGRDFSGHYSGDPEFSLPRLAAGTEFIKRNLGNYLLYKGVYDTGNKIVSAEHQIHKDLTQNQAPSASRAIHTTRRPNPAAVTGVDALFEKTDPGYTDPDPVHGPPRPMKDHPDPLPPRNRRTTVGMAHDARMRWRQNMPEV